MLRVAVTVYNQSFGVVRETRDLRLARGKVELAFKDVSARIQPETVQLREKYVGRTIDVYRSPRAEDRRLKSPRASSCSASNQSGASYQNAQRQLVAGDEVEDFEPTDGDFTVVELSLPFMEKDAATFTFNVMVPARGKTKVTYRVRLRYC